MSTSVNVETSEQQVTPCRLVQIMDISPIVPPFFVLDLTLYSIPHCVLTDAEQLPSESPRCLALC
jgi:hypothetical protein